VGGCTTVKVQKQYTGSALPIPDRILVHDFSYSPSQIKLDRGISPRIEKAMKGTSRSYAELKAGEAVCDVVAEKLVQEIRDMGLPAQRGGGDTVQFGNTVSIEGQFLTINEGDRVGRGRYPRPRRPTGAQEHGPCSWRSASSNSAP
jgi:hypothetical protein